MRTSTWSWLMARRTPYETERPRLGNGSHNDALDAVRALRALLPPARLDGHAALPAPVLRLRPARAAARRTAAAAGAAAARPGVRTGSEAEREGFEPSNEVDPRYAISSRARSTAPAPLRADAVRVAARPRPTARRPRPRGRSRRCPRRRCRRS